MPSFSDSIFDYRDYRDYLHRRLQKSGPSRGLRKKLAEKINTRPSFVSRVLSGEIDLSPEHIPPTNEFLGHAREEAHYFTLLALKGRAGSSALSNYYGDQIEELGEKRKEFAKRVKVAEGLKPERQAIYYSQWYYAAIHVLVAIPGFQRKDALVERLHLAPEVVAAAVEFLKGEGLVEEKAGSLRIGKNRIHIAKNSHWIGMHHLNFRQRAIVRIPNARPEDFHYSILMGISRKDFRDLRKKMLDLIVSFEPILEKSDVEEMYALNLDLFEY